MWHVSQWQWCITRNIEHHAPCNNHPLGFFFACFGGFRATREDLRISVGFLWLLVGELEGGY